jgi:5-methylcytosine-specific restriction endonuclease McrA
MIMVCAFYKAQTMPPKQTIPKALREQVWIANVGPAFQTKCLVRWCQNQISVFDFEVGHNIPESKGGTLEITNLRPICSRCNKSMSDNYTIDEWNKLGGGGVQAVGCCGCFG